MNKLQIRLRDEATTEIDRRAEPMPNGPGRSDSLESITLRYAGLMRRARMALKEKFSGEELSLLADVMNGCMSDENTVYWMRANIDDAINMDHVDEKWGVDGQKLLVKLARLSQCHTLALVDAIEIFWRRVGAGEHETDPCKLLEF